MESSLITGDRSSLINHHGDDVMEMEIFRLEMEMMSTQGQPTVSHSPCLANGGFGTSAVGNRP